MKDYSTKTIVEQTEEFSMEHPVYIRDFMDLILSAKDWAEDKGVKTDCDDWCIISGDEERVIVRIKVCTDLLVAGHQL